MPTKLKWREVKASILVISSISKWSKHIRSEENYFQSNANIIKSKEIIFKAKQTRPTKRGGAKQSKPSYFKKSH